MSSKRETKAKKRITAKSTNNSKTKKALTFEERLELGHKSALKMITTADQNNKIGLSILNDYLNGKNLPVHQINDYYLHTGRIETKGYYSIDDKETTDDKKIQKLRITLTDEANKELQNYIHELVNNKQKVKAVHKFIEREPDEW